MGNDSVTSKLFRVHASREELADLFAERYGEEIICFDVLISEIIDTENLEEIAAL